MADSGSFNADLGINMQFNIDGAGLVEMTKTIKEISKGKDLQRYWKDVEAATDSATKAIERYNKNTQSKGLAENFLKQINALKAITNKENMADIFPNMDINFDELIESAKKLAPKINAEFSSSNFSQAFKTFDLLKDKGIELSEVFSKLADYSSKVDENFKLRRENNEFRNLFGEQDIDKIKKDLSEIQKLRNEAEETFNNFLSINKIEKTDYWGNEQFSEYFNGIRNGSLTATEAIVKFKTEYTYLLEKSFKSNNDTFGLDQLKAFSTKLDSIFRQVEETSNKINDIISNGVIAKSVQNLSEDTTLPDSQRSIFGNILQDEESLKSITALFQKLIDETNQPKNTEVFNTEQFTKIESLFTSIESSLSSIKGVLVDVGDGEELSPLLKQLDNIREATSNIKLSLNLDLGNEVSERLNQKVSQSTQRQLEAYRKLFSAMKGTGKTNKEMLKFFEPDEASATELIGAYQGIIRRAEEKFKVGNSNAYKKLLGSTYDDLKKEIKNANAQLGRAENKRSENEILGDLFGDSKDLSGVIEQLNTIVSKLDEISVSAKGFAETFKNGLNVNASVDEIEKLTNRVKELESELAKIKTPTTVVTPQESNISFGDSTSNAIDTQVKKQREYNDLVAVGYDRIQKMKRISESGTTGQNSVYDLLRLNHEAWDEVKANNFFNTIPEEGLKRYTKILEVVEKIVQEMVQASGLTEDQIVSQLKNIKSAQGGNFKLNGADSGWTHFATYSNGQKDSMQKPNGITYKVYAAFDDIKDLNQNVVSSIMDELTKAGFKGRLKTTSGSTSFGDKLNGLAITDQMVVHGSTKKDQEIAYNTLKNMGLKLSYLGGGIDTPDGSFSQTLASGEINKYVQGLEKEATTARDTAKAEQELANARKESTSTVSQNQKKDAFHSDIDTSSSVKSLENLEEEIKKIFTDVNELQNILDSLHNGKYFHLSWTTDGIDATGADERVRQLSKLLKEYGYTINNFKSDSDAFDTSGVINSIKEENNVLEQNTQKVKENTQAKEQNTNVNFNGYDKRLDSYNGKVDKYQATIDRFNDGGWTSDTYLKNVQAVRDAVKQYATLLDNIKTNQNGIASDEDIQNLDKYEKKIKDTIATVTNMSASEKGYNFVSAQKELDKIHKLLNENSNMSAEAKAKIKSYYAEIESGNPSMSLDRIHGEIMKIYNAEVEAGRAGKSFFDTLKNSGFHQIAAQMAGMFGFYDVINLGKQAIEVVTELDSAFTEMRKVSDETTQSLKNYQKTTFDTANDVGTTAMQIQNSTADWQRLGYSLDEASKLAKNSNIYKNVGDMDIDEATEHMISSVQAWKSEFSDAVTASEEIMNRYNKIGNEFAISSADIGEAMETSGAALKAGENDLNESIGLITAGNLIQQDASTTASAMKILSLRIRGAKADLDAMGESTDDLSDSTSKMREELKALTGVDIMKDENTFKSTAEIIQEMGKNWDKLTDVSKAAALEKLAGKNRASTVSGLIENYKTIGKVIEAAENSENSALEENEKYLESIEGRTQKLTNQLQELAFISIKDDWIKNAISGLTTLLGLVTKLVDKIGIVPTILSGVGIFKGIKTFSKNLA